MLSLLTEIRDLLRRPVVPTASAVSPTIRVKGKVAAPEPEQPVTEEELRTALTRLHEQAAEARRTIGEAGDRRERLLEQDSSDAEIEAVNREVTSANLMLARISRVAPEVANKLRDVEDANKQARFLELRDVCVSAGRAYIGELRASAAVRGHEYFAARGRLHDEFKNAPTPKNEPGISWEAVDLFEEQLRQFSHMAFNARPKPVHPNLASALEAPNADPEELSRVFGAISVMRLRPQVKVRLLQPWQPHDGKWLKGRTVLLLSGKEADVLVRHGMAEMANEDDPLTPDAEAAA